MKTSGIEKLCKDERRIILYKGNGCQWIGVNGAVYSLVGVKNLTVEQVMTLFDVKPADVSKFNTDMREELPSVLCFDDNMEGEVALTLPELGIGYKGEQMLPFVGQSGLFFVNAKYFKPYSGVDYSVFSRFSKSGQEYVVVKEGFFVTGVIMPVVPNQGLAERLCEIAELLKEMSGDE